MKISKLNIQFTLTNDETIEFHSVAKKKAQYQQKGFVLNTSISENVLWLSLARRDNKTFDLKNVVYDVHLPLLNFGKVIVPDSGRFYMDTFFPRQVWNKKYELVGRAFGNPFLALLDSMERGLFAIGLMGDMMETCFHFYSPGANRKSSLTVQGGKLKFRITKPIGEDLKIGKNRKFDDGIFTMNEFETWFHALREYGRVYRKVRKLKFNKNANSESLSPAMCTWRVINSDSMTHDWIVAQAEQAAELGIGSIIFDDGWYGVGLDGMSSYNDMGNWPRKIKGKFQDIEKTVKAVQKKGVKAILWYCPISIGPQCSYIEDVKDLLCWVKNEETGQPELYKVAAGFHALCPRNPKARQLMYDNLKKLIVDYGADGVKIDLFDYMPAVPCVADHEHDLPTTTEGVKKFFREAFQLSQKWKPGSLYSVKNNYGNIEISPFASCIRGGDSPFDENINFLRSIYPAAYVPVTHNDYLVWTNFELDWHLAAIIMKQLVTGVPNFTVDLVKMKKRQKEIMKVWLDFFWENKQLFGPEANFQPQNASMTAFERTWKSVSQISAIAPGQGCALPDKATKIYLFNLTGNDQVFLQGRASKNQFKIRSYNFKRQPVGLEQKLKLDTSHTLEIPCPGYAEMTVY